MDIDFLRDIKLGLVQTQKSIPSTYFYDEIGSDILMRKTKNPVYYPAVCEMEIMQEQGGLILDKIQRQDSGKLRIIELGAGEGLKTIELLKFAKTKYDDLSFYPIDICGDFLEVLAKKTLKAVPDLPIFPQLGDNMQVLKELSKGDFQNFILFLGSSLGNMYDEEAKSFLAEISAIMQPDDYFLLGLDLIKSPEVILPAYNEAAGLTAEFNYNLLRRINKELGGRFDLSKFLHTPIYSVEKQRAESYLTSLEEQDVYIAALERAIHFREDEKIHTEISRKFDDEVILDFMEGTSLELEGIFTDSRNYFSDYLFRKK